MLDAYIYDGVRSPFGRHAGALSGVRPDDLLASVLKGLVERNPFPAEAYEDVIAGCVTQAAEDSRNVARFSSLIAGLPIELGGLTVNRLCGSGLSAVLDAARCVTVKEADLYLAGGVESMSRAPFVMAKSESPFQRSFQMYDTTIGSRFPNPAVAEQYGVESMPETGDNVAKDFQITRDEADSFAYNSQQRYEAARADGFFDEEILPVDVPQGRKKPPLTISTDEHPRPETSLEKMQSLRPLFEGGVVTAANASGVNDGAGALIVGSGEAGEAHGAKPRARILAGAIAGVAPRIMGVGPAYAIPKALDRAGLSLADMDLIEINEAFASQVIGCLRILGLSADDERLNPNGGAIAVGHPLGASGARIALTGLRQLERTGGRYAVLSMCIGVGQGIAMVIERLDA
ncbi:MAG: 3-oxoadipyl-CoA thiolase [Pseudomonadota bacterium]